jgi:isochorismate synthase
MGPLFLNGRTNLFVTLRCMQVFVNGYRLYAGGGLLKDSIEEQEWQETETKLDTMRHIIYNNV